MGARVAVMPAAKRRYRSAMGAALGKMNLHNVYADGQQVAGLDEAGKLDVLSRLTAFSNTDAGKTQVVVSGGETLRSLAQRVYGNASLWYVIAEANALNSDEDLVAGASLTVPEVRVSSNDANTFRPYNPGEITGPTSPGLPYIPSADAGCNQIAAVIRVVVTAVLMVTPLGPFAAMAFAGIGEVAAQSVEISGGQRPGYDWGGVAVSAISAGYGAKAGANWIDDAQSVAGTYARTAVVAAGKAAVNYTGSYAINKALGQDASFSWRELAVSSVSTAITSSLLGGSSPRTGANGLATNAMHSVAFSWKALALEAVSSVARQGVSHVVQDTIQGNAHWDWESVLQTTAQDVAVVGLAGNLASSSRQDIRDKQRRRQDAETAALADQAMQRIREGLSVPEYEIGPGGATSEERRVARAFGSQAARYQGADGHLWVDVPEVSQDTGFKDLATGEQFVQTPTLPVVPDAQRSQDFINLWGYARNYGVAAPASAAANDLQHWRATIGTQMRDQYNRWAVQNQAYYRSQPEFGTYTDTRRVPTQAEIGAKLAQENMGFLKFMGATAVAGITPALATASPIAGAVFTGWGLGSSANSFREGHYVKGTIEAAGALLGMRALASEARFLGQIPTASRTAANTGIPLIRQQYIDEVRSLEDVGLNLQAAGATPEQTARVLGQMRRSLGIDYKAMTPPDELARIYARNLEKYGDELGPTIEYLRARGKTWQDIIDSASRPGGKDLGY